MRHKLLGLISGDRTHPSKARSNAAPFTRILLYFGQHSVRLCITCFNDYYMFQAFFMIHRQPVSGFILLIFNFVPGFMGSFIAHWVFRRIHLVYPGL